MALTNKQQAFINEYLQCWNATEAARRAGYSEKSARSIGAENLTKPDIDAEIRSRIAEHAMGPDEVLARLGEQARANFGDIMRVVETHDGVQARDAIAFDWDKVKEYGHLIKSVSFTQAGPKVEFYDKQAALVHIGKHHGLFTDNVNTSGEVNIRVHYADD